MSPTTDDRIHEKAEETPALVETESSEGNPVVDSVGGIPILKGWRWVGYFWISVFVVLFGLELFLFLLGLFQ